MQKRPNLIKVGTAFAVLFALGVLGVLLAPAPAAAKPLVPEILLPLRVENTQEVFDNDQCLICHRVEGMVLPLDDGEELYLTVDPEGFATSVHGQMDFKCVDCHTNITGYPHPEFSAVDRRSVSQLLTQACANCHVDQAENYSQGQHAKAFAQGNLNTALCVDCHSAHSVKDIRGSKVEIAKVCQACHSDIYDVYKDSVHGAALLEEDNYDVPTCSNCHDNHSNTGPSDPGYVLFSPQLCATCHADEELMGKYGINTDVFETYISDFHGTTVQIFEQIAPDQETNKPVCIDCHGVHDIRSPEDSASTVMKENLLTTCQRCHPDATVQFDDSWLGHYKPDIEKYPLIYIVNLFYMIVIPVTVGGMLFFIVTEIGKTLSMRWKRKKTVAAESGSEEGDSSNE